jgi:hypothetical protein
VRECGSGWRGRGGRTCEDYEACPPTSSSSSILISGEY